MKKISEISKIYFCENCNYNCSKQSEWSKHLLTSKHENRTNIEQKISKISKNSFQCKYCQKSYVARNSVWYHEQKCKNNEHNEHNEHNEPSEDDDNSLQENLLLSNLILEVVKQNKELMKENGEFKDMMLEQNKLVLEIAKNGTNVINNSNNMNNSHNKTFNLQIFLNETCKDAMNIMDFVDSLKLQLCDLERIGEVGFVTGISDIIIKNLKALDISKRPVHCADTKREVMYVKDNDKWEKEQEGNKKLKKAIKHIAKKNSMNINLFKDKYPDCINSHSRKSDQFNKIYIEAYGGSGNEDVDNENKIIKNIAKVVGIDKSL